MYLLLFKSPLWCVPQYLKLTILGFLMYGVGKFKVSKDLESHIFVERFETCKDA